MPRLDHAAPAEDESVLDDILELKDGGSRSLTTLMRQ
jgi:hypothetical protein